MSHSREWRKSNKNRYAIVPDLAALVQILCQSFWLLHAMAGVLTYFTSNVQTSITKDMSLGCIPYKLYLFIRNIMVCCHLHNFYVHLPVVFRKSSSGLLSLL